MTILRTRLAAGLGTGAAAAFALALAAGSATAAPDSTKWHFDDSGLMGEWTFTTSITDTTPKVGDEITIANTLTHTKVDRYVYKVKQVVPQCLDFVKATGSGTIASTQDKTGTADSYVLVNAPTGGWRIDGASSSLVKVNVTYKVTEDCATGNAQQTVMHMSGSTIGDQNFNNPISFTVAKPTPPGGGDGGTGDGDGDGDGDGGGNNGGDGSTGGGNNGGGTGSLDTGSLGNLFG
ncbi:hypothetical protein [Gordonia alkaliphila]|uniref:Alternate-type signal peptide domain-containing protein n=1 Tax=Gordonia alkaliphila TaxID=1053547 RepID=A0ABP8Z3E8_9ACTN